MRLQPCKAAGAEPCKAAEAEPCRAVGAEPCRAAEAEPYKAAEPYTQGTGARMDMDRCAVQVGVSDTAGH